MRPFQTLHCDSVAISCQTPRLHLPVIVPGKTELGLLFSTPGLSLRFPNEVIKNEPLGNGGLRVLTKAPCD